MKIKDIMNRDVVICSPDDTIRHVANLLKKYNISGLPVVKDKKVVGIVSEGDILKLLEVPDRTGLWLPSPFEIIEVPIRGLINWEETKRSLEDVGSKPISEIMKKKVHTISADDTIGEAAKMLNRYRVNRLPVVENDILVGIVTRGDIIRGIGEI